MQDWYQDTPVAKLNGIGADLDLRITQPELILKGYSLSHGEISVDIRLTGVIIGTKVRITSDET